MDVFRKAMSIVYNGLAGQTKQEWSNDSSKVRVMLVGDDILDNYASASTPDIYQTLNNFGNISCFNCAIKGNTMDALLNNKAPSSLVRLNRPYEYPQNIDGQFDVLKWSNRTHWTVLSVGYNEKKQGISPLDTYERQLTSIIDQILKKNKNCIVVSVNADRWSEFKNMVERICTLRHVSFLVDSPSLGQDIYNVIQSTTSTSNTLNLVIEPPVDSFEECKTPVPVPSGSDIKESKFTTPVPSGSTEESDIQESKVSTPVRSGSTEESDIQESRVSTPVLSGSTEESDIQESKVSTPVCSGSTEESDIQESRVSTPVRQVTPVPVISQNSMTPVPVQSVVMKESVQVETALATSMEPALEVDDGLAQWERSVNHNSSSADI
jgi:hypothetical protein